MPGRNPLGRNAESVPDTVKTLEFVNTEVRDVLAFYATLKKVRLIIEPTVQGILNINVKEEISKDEALRLIEQNLLMSNFIFVPAGRDTFKVLFTKSPRTQGISLLSDELQLPENEQVVSFLLKLRFADPTETTAFLLQYLGGAGSTQGVAYSQVLPLPKSQAVLITENSIVIRSLLQIVRVLDMPPAEVESEFISLERADAKDVLEKLEQIFGKNQPNATGAPTLAGIPRRTQPVITPEGNVIPPEATATPAGPDSVEISAGTLSEDSIIVGKIKITADIRTNRLHVVTRPINLRFIRKLIREFDRDVKFGEPSIRKLQHVQAGDILDVIVKSISDPGQKDAAGGATAGARPGGTGGNRGGAGGGGSLLGGGGGDSFGGQSGGGGGRSGGGLSLSESLNTEERDIVPEAVIVGNTKIIADKRVNQIIVLGNQEVKAKIFALIDDLDTRSPQVTLHTIIGELNLNTSERFSVNYILNNGTRRGLLGNGGTIGTPGTPGTPTVPGDGTGTGSAANNGPGVSISGGTPVLNFGNLLGSTSITQALTAGATGLSGFVAAGNAFNAIVNALESNDRFRVVSRPTLHASNNKKATIASGEEIAVPTSIQSGFGGGSVNNGSNLVTNSSIQFKTVALQLEILPLINSEREVTLDIVQKVDERAGTTRIDNNDIPNIATRVIKTTVTVPNEGTLVLGGLIKSTESNLRSGIPYLSRIPVIGPLFGSKSKVKTRTELIILIRPVVSMGPCEAVDQREREMEFLNVDPDLETTLYPQNLRKKVQSEPALRRSPLILRQPTECVDESILKGTK